MENLTPTQETEKKSDNKISSPLIIFIVAFIIVAVALWQFTLDKSEPIPVKPDSPVQEEPVIEVPEVSNEPEVIELPAIETVIEQPKPITLKVVLPEPVINPLPNIDESDEWLKEKLPTLTWRNELLSLLVTDDLIRRFVVFTDNFAQGLIAYEHSVFTQPKSKFSIDEQKPSVTGEKNVWQWDESNSKRFNIYVDLLRSVESSTLVDLYMESKPLIDEAYSELGYEENFTYTLQDAITRVLDMELPQSTLDVTRTSVMYKFQDPELESLDDGDKLLLRIGKENLLIIKSVLLEINEKLSKSIENNQ